MALVAASYFHNITLNIASSPSDFVMVGFYQGKPLPCLPFACRHPLHEKPPDPAILEESKW